MEEDKKEETLFTVRGKGGFRGENTDLKITAELFGKKLKLDLGAGDIADIPLIRIITVRFVDYTVELETATGCLVLKMLGTVYDGFMKAFLSSWHDEIASHLLMSERMKASFSPIRLDFRREDGRSIGAEGEIRLYSSALVLIPEAGRLERISLGEIENCVLNDHKYEIGLQGGSALSISKLGRQTDLFGKKLEELLAGLSERSRDFIKGIFPGIDALELRNAVKLIREGRLVFSEEICSVSPALRDAIEAYIGSSNTGPYIGALSNIVSGDRGIGFKKGLMGDLSGDYLWLFLPIPKERTGTEADYVLLETVSQEKGRAAYLFRDIRENGQNGLRGFMTELNRAMNKVDFRREPVYMEEDDLRKPGNEEYLYAYLHIDELKMLRRAFAGRLIHGKGDHAEILRGLIAKG